MRIIRSPKRILLGVLLLISLFIFTRFWNVHRLFSSDLSSFLLPNGRSQVHMETYCNDPTSGIFGFEGVVSKVDQHFRLASVGVIIRHGARQTVVPSEAGQGNAISCDVRRWTAGLPHHSSLLLSFWAFVQAAQDSVLLQDLADHLVQPECSLGHLTPLGVLQHISLGEHLASTLGLSLNTTKPRTALVSTAYQRTRISLAALLFGWFGGDARLTLSYVKSASLAGSDPGFCSPIHGFTCNCHRLRTLERHMSSFANSNPPCFNANSKLTESLKLRRSQLPHMLDVAAASLCHGGQLCPAEDSCLQHSNFNKAWECYSHRQSLNSKRSVYVEFHHLSVFPVLSQLFTKLSDRSPTSPQLVIFSGHDNTIFPVLWSLGVVETQWPPFASRLIFEVYSSRDAPSARFLRLLYNGVDVTERITVCANQLAYGLCPLYLLAKAYSTQLYDSSCSSY